VKLTSDEALVKAALADPRTAPISEKLRAALLFVEKITMTPAEVGPGDIAALRAAGLTDRAIEEALHVVFLFNTIDRIADAFDFELTPPKGLKWVARILSGPGYKMASVPG
jgi:alkylhydroperoxidase family enzyme